MVSVSGESCTAPKGAQAPGKQCPMPVVPIIGLTYFETCAKAGTDSDSVVSKHSNGKADLFMVSIIMRR